MLVLVTSTAASAFSIISSVAAAYHRWGVVLVMQIVCGLAWIAAEAAIMAELEDPMKMLPCVIPAIGQVVAGSVGCVKFYMGSRSVKVLK